MAAVGLSGCERLTEGPEGRINEAIAVSAELQAAYATLVALAPEQQRGVLADQYASRLKLRALSCASGYTPSMFTSAQAIRDALRDRTCFQQSDAATLQWLRLRRVGVMLSAPPLVPVPQRAVPVVSVGAAIRNADFPAKAGVAILMTDTEAVVVSLADGRLLRREAPRTARVPFTTWPSPNGRLMVWEGAQASMELRSTESGEVVASLDAAGVFQWLDDRFAVYQSKERRELVVADFATGKLIDMPGFNDELRYAAPLGDAPGEHLLCFFRSFARIRLVPDATGASVQLLREAPNPTQSSYLSTSGVTADGRHHFQAVGPALAITSLATFDQERISLAPASAHSAVPLTSDRFLFMASRRSSGGRTAQLVYSIGERTVAEVADASLSAAAIRYVPSLGAWASTGVDGSRLVLLDSIPTAAAEPVEQFAAREQEAANQAKLAAAMRAAEAGENPATAPVRPSQMPPLAAMAANAQLEGVGVYQGSGPRVRSQERQTGAVAVRVRRSSKPLVLVLASYEPVRWTLQLEPGARLAGVLLYGYHASQVVGAGDARVLVLGRHYAYRRDSAEFSGLDAEVERQTGRRIGTFQGRYDGDTFSVGTVQMF